MIDLKDFNLKLDRNAQIIGLLTSNSEVWNNVPKFQSAVNQLESYQKELLILNGLLFKDLSSFEKEKNDTRKELEERTMTVVRILQNFAHDKKKSKMQKRLYYITPEYIKDYLDLNLIKIAGKTWLIANKYGGYGLTFISKINSALNSKKSNTEKKFEKEFGLNSDMIKRLEDATVYFTKAMVAYNGEIEEKERVKLKMKKINKKTKKLLTNKIDRLTTMFENENPAFCAEYNDLNDHFTKRIKEAKSEMADFQELLVDEIQVIQTEPKQKRKGQKKKTED